MAPLGAFSLAWLSLSGGCSSSAGFCSVTLPTLSFSSRFLESLRSLARGPGGVDDRSSRHSPGLFENLCVQRERSMGLPLLSISPNFWVLPIRTLITPVFQKLVKALVPLFMWEGKARENPRFDGEVGYQRAAVVGYPLVPTTISLVASRPQPPPTWSLRILCRLIGGSWECMMRMPTASSSLRSVVSWGTY